MKTGPRLEGAMSYAMMRCPASHAMLHHARFLGTDACGMGMAMMILGCA